MTRMNKYQSVELATIDINNIATARQPNGQIRASATIIFNCEKLGPDFRGPSIRISLSLAPVDQLDVDTLELRFLDAATDALSRFATLPIDECRAIYARSRADTLKLTGL